MLNNLTLNSIFWLFVSLVLVAFGAYVGRSWRMYPFAAGLIFLGAGSFLCGLTNGFTDYSHNGRLFCKIGGLLLAVGSLLSIYGVLKFI